ncbi:MAG: potassium channel protein [Spirochaetae bacterium HGW-Spirochaetae-1]|nr:MAG: potassium channel protein [Spirochaetae bacterium HGW-Spirochaetae-1]
MRKLRIALTLLGATIAIGTMGYHVIEGMTVFEAFYMTIITISSVGFQEVRPLTVAGRIITIFVIVTGITIAGYTLGTILRMFIEGELRKTFGRRKVEKKIAELTNHYIICGYGRIGKLIVKELDARNMDHIVIENDAQSIEELEVDGYLYLPMDATADETLVKAGIQRAKAIVTAVKSDSDNVFITLTARGLNPNIFILARSSEEKNEMKLRRAGASRVVSPYLIGGKRMAQVLIKPTVVDFIDIAIMESHLGLQMEEAVVRPGSHLVGKNLVQSNLRKDYGVIIVLIKKHSGEMIFNPLPVEVLEENDVIVMMGKTEDMVRMTEVI